MGFDNESIINIQSLPGEYFCPVCRQLVYPNEALQTQCTHLYCKPCLTYVVSTTRACPYDGYLVTDTDSKPLQEANSTLAETIGRVVVHCLYHKSGCTWQGPLSESIGHGNGCPYGSSPVVCNRCGTQIVHRQVQEHAQNCPGTQAQVQAPSQQQENAQQAQGAVVAAGQYDQNQVAQAVAQQYPAQAAVQAPQVAASQPTQYGVGQDPAQSVAMQQGAAQASANDQWYQQQYQQYYQQYPQYDQYQQYQQYDQYQQQVQVQLQQQAQAQPHPQVQHPQAQAQAQAQAQPHTQLQHPQAQSQPHTPVQHPQAQAQPQAQGQPQHHHQTQPQSQVQAQAQPLVQAAHASQPYQQVQGQTVPPPQQVQPQQQVMQAQPHQMMPNQSQVPVQQHSLPMQSQQQPVQQPQQHPLYMQQQFPPSQQPQMHQQHPPSQQPTHMQQQLPAMVGQQIPQQQPPLQHHPQVQHPQQIMQQPPAQQQLMLQQQIPSQLQQTTQGPMQHPQPYPPQPHQMPHQPQQQPPFHPTQSVHAPQYMQSQIQPGSQHHPQLQPPFQQGQPPSQSFSQPYPQNAGQMNAPQQAGNRPPMAQNQGFVQQSLPQGRPHHAPYGQPIRAPNKALQAAPNQTYMPRPGQRAHVPHQRPPIHQSSVPRSTNQTTFMPGSAPSQSVRANAQTAAASGVPKVAPVVEKMQEGLPQENITKIQVLQKDQSLHPTKPAQLNEANNAPGQNNDLETVKTESINSENKSNDNEQRLANEKVEEKTLPASEASKNEVSDSSQQQISNKDFQVVKHEADSQLVAQKKVHEDGSQKPEEVGTDKISQDLTVNLQDSIEERSHSHQDGNIQQYPHEVHESDFLHNATRQPQETRGLSDEKKQKITRPLVESKQWQEGNNLQQSSQGQDRNLQQPLRQGPGQGLDKSSLQHSRHGPVQLQERTFQHTSRHGPVQGQDRNLPGPPRQGPIHGQERNMLQPSRQGLSHVHNRGLQQPLRGPAPGQDRNSQLPIQQGLIQAQDRPLQQPLQNERDMQQVSAQSQVQGHEMFQQPPRQVPLQGQQFPYTGQSQSHERNIHQLPYPVQTHNIPEQFQHSSSKQGGMPPMSLLPQHQPGSSSMPSFGRGHSQAQSQQKKIDMASPSNLHPPQMASRSQLGESMLGLPSSLPPSMSHHLGAFEGPRGLMDMALQFGPSSQQSPLSKSVDHKDILGNKRPELFENKQNELQQSTGSRFLMTPPSGFQPNIMKPNGGTSKGQMEGMQSSLFPPIMGDEGSFRSMHQDQGRHTSDRREYQESSRKYKPGQFDVQLSSNPDEILPSLRHQKGQAGSTSKFDQIPPMTRPLEAGPHGFLPDSMSKYPLPKAASPGGPSSRLFPPYQSTASFPPSSGGPSMFSSDIGDGPRLPGIHEDMMARRSESAGIRPDFMGPRSEFGRTRHDPLAPPRSPGKDIMGLTSGRPNVVPSGGFGPGFGGPSHLSRPIEDMNRDPLSFEEQRNKPFGFHSAAMHNVFQPGQFPMDVGNRFAPFHSGPVTGPPGPLPNHMMMGDPGPGFGPNVPMQAFPGENALFNKQGQMLSDFEPSELGRKRKPGSMGWCRICQIDCYTVEGLEQHTLMREHQKKAMDMVMSIKQDNAKRQKLSSEDPTTQENGNKPKRTGFEGRGSRR